MAIDIVEYSCMISVIAYTSLWAGRHVAWEQLQQRSIWISQEHSTDATHPLSKVPTVGSPCEVHNAKDSEWQLWPWVREVRK